MNRVFSNDDQLRLLQLMTRKVMKERLRPALEEEGEQDEGEQARVASEEVVIPQKWRLVSDEISLYDWQRDCLPRWLAQGRGTVKVATGGGKTLFALAAAQKLQNEQMPDLRLAIVVPTIPLLFQWYDELKNGNLPLASIGLMGGGQELSSSAGLRILICVLNSARDRLPGFASKAHWSGRMLLVVDECHRANAAQAQRIFDSAPRYTLGLSATPERDAEDEGLPTDEAYEQSAVGQALGPIIYDFTINQSLAAGLLTPFEVWHIGLTLTPPEASEHARLSREITELRKTLQVRHRKSRSKQSFIAWCQTLASRGGSGAAEAERFIGLANGRKRLLYKAKARADAVVSILAHSVADQDGRGIVFHESIEEIEALFLQAEELGLPVVLEHSKLPDSLRAESIDAFRKGIARVIISAKSLVEGFNVPSADLGIIAASSGSVRQRIQSLGRMLRRKQGGRTARIMVLYVRDTEDEAIYEKADWESIVGAERNRYFHWNSPEDGQSWECGLKETSKSPRLYRPPSWEVNVSSLQPGEPYPGQATGHELRVDQSGNLRTEDDVLIPTDPALVNTIVECNPHRRARRTPAGHLIVRVDDRSSDAADWRYLGCIELPEEPVADVVKRLKLKSSSGKRVIALEDEADRKVVHFALGPDSSTTREGGEARDRLLEWVQSVEADRGVTVRDIFWDTGTRYWLEVKGERVNYQGTIAPVEFKT